MPLYEYECSKGHRFEAIQKVSDKPLKKCMTCAAAATRAISRPTLIRNAASTFSTGLQKMQRYGRAHHR